MSNATTRPNAADMLREVQNYRTSLESLMEVGRTLLDVPSMEENSAVAFTVLAENILEEAGHQDDLATVAGVDEPAAKVELIMQDVLKPRILESERVESTLADKAESEVPDPFHTSHDMTEKPAMESLQQMAEVLNLYHDNVKLARTLVSMEGLDLETIRPVIMETLGKFGGQLDALGVSMEDVGKTQVLGELSDAVSRVEKLVEKAKESVEEKIGAQMDEDVKVSSIDNDDASELEEGVVDNSDDGGESLDDDVQNEVDDPDDDSIAGENDLMSDVEDIVEDDEGVAVEEEEEDESGDLDEEEEEVELEEPTDDLIEPEEEEEDGDDEPLEVDGEDNDDLPDETNEEGEPESVEDADDTPASEEEEDESNDLDEEEEMELEEPTDELEMPEEEEEAEVVDTEEEEETSDDAGGEVDAADGDTTHVNLNGDDEELALEEPTDELEEPEEEEDSALD